jgi:nucleotide-binding universal stress UspA family protein
MGRDRIVAPELNEVHPRFGTPYRAIAITGGLILLFIVAGNVELLATLGSVLHLIIYGLLNVALIVFREAEVAEYDPVFTVPLYPFTPIVGTIVSFALIVFIEPMVVAISAALVGAATLWYFGYARSRTEAEGELSEFILSRRQRMPDAAVSAATSVKPDGGQHRVMVPLANPEHEENLMTLASAVAKHHGGVVDAVHIVTVPDQTSLEYAVDHLDEHEEDYHAVLDQAQEDAETFGVSVETHTIVSHRGFEEIFDAARTHDADTVVMGWGPDAHGSPGRAEAAFDDLAMDLPCDFLVVKDRGFDPGHIVVPTRGGPGSAYAAGIASLLQAEYGSEITLVYVADSEEAAEAEDFLEEWASERGLADATLRVESGDVADRVVEAAGDASLVIVGASERGLLVRLVRGSPVGRIVDEVGCSAILAEQKHERSFVERLLRR